MPAHFTREAEYAIDLPGNVLLQAPGFRVRAAILDHGIPCLAFALEEQRHISVRKNRLAELGLSTGPWLKGLKQAVLRDAPDDTPIRLDDGRTLPLGHLRDAIIDLTPGYKTAYVVDSAYTPENRARIIELARDADEGPCPVMFRKPVAFGHSMPRSQAARLMPRAMGCSDGISSAAANRRQAVSSRSPRETLKKSAFPLALVEDQKPWKASATMTGPAACPPMLISSTTAA